ncbi:hypothetical protein [Streptomyces sp. NPDC056948]|uniref:hypothetical protein n=1 Tax=Streptomyces sp. NPDC056948 TaxID=3345975 RepID=UPI00362B3349
MAKDETTYDFPMDLIKAQDELDAVRGELKKLLEEQPWSVEPLPAWTTHETCWRPSSRPASPGWDPTDQQRIGTLRARELEIVTLILNHSFWQGIEGYGRTAARNQLKHHRERTLETSASSASS